MSIVYLLISWKTWAEPRHGHAKNSIILHGRLPCCLHAWVLEFFTQKVRKRKLVISNFPKHLDLLKSVVWSQRMVHLKLVEIFDFPWPFHFSPLRELVFCWSYNSSWQTMEIPKFHPSSNRPFSTTRQRIWVSPSVSESLGSLVYVSWLSESKTPKLMHANNMETSHAK